jgi:GTPase SAR1 family protein
MSPEYVKKEGIYILIGNKIDLKDQKVVSTEDGESFSKEINASDFIETSAKYGENVEKAFTNLVYQILRNLNEID